MPKAANGPSVPRASWNSSCDSMLVESLKKQKQDGKMGSNSSWHSSAWVEAEKDLTGTETSSGGGKKTALSCQNRWSALKKEYVQVAQLRDKSGFGWDEGLSLVTATAEVWDALLKSDPKLAKWKKTAFPLYESLHDLIYGTVATGKEAFRPGRDFTPFSIVTESGEDGDMLSYHTPSFQNDMTDDEETAITGASVPPVPVMPWRSAVTPRKRAADASFESASSIKQIRGRKPTAGHAITEVASSVRDLATAFVGSMGSTSTPERKTAIQMLEEDDDLSEDEKIDAIQLFRKDSTIAQSYLSIRKKDTPFAIPSLFAPARSFSA
ncbi:hypothetical protein CVT25_012285 [Psilocybe cyanescens]|uniref:Myb-like domain-containing protein n=1 Tax=Psilocybe cyanescens TaxID=93625 RepID=A0A409XLF7_PSICY|nr:hypothetical protein CVT25_012285 [Psilocybe cyanescens]